MNVAALATLALSVASHQGALTAQRPFVVDGLRSVDDGDTFAPTGLAGVTGPLAEIVTVVA